MAKTFLILQARPETPVSDDEYQAILRMAGLSEDQTTRIRLDQTALPDKLSLDDYYGVILGGGPGCVSDPLETKTKVEARIEEAVLGLLPAITETDTPFLGCCLGMGMLGAHLGGDVAQSRFGEPVGAVTCEVQAPDPLLNGIPAQFDAFVGHKEALQSLPDKVTHLVSSGPCPFQMIRYKSNIYATQFHPEADADGFALRINYYKDKGYFAPEDAEQLIAMCRAASVTYPAQILRNFATRYGG